MDKSYFLRLKDIPSKGLFLTIDDQAIWLSYIKEFELPYEINEDFHVEVFILVEGECCILKGVLTGVLDTLCDRCLEKAQVEIEDHSE